MCHQAHKNIGPERQRNVVRTKSGLSEGEGGVVRHGKRGRKAFLYMSVDSLHHYVLSTTDGLLKNVARKEQPSVWGEE